MYLLTIKKASVLLFLLFCFSFDWFYFMLCFIVFILDCLLLFILAFFSLNVEGKNIAEKI